MRLIMIKVDDYGHEYYKESFKDKIGNVILSFQTSFLVRKFMRSKVENAIQKVDANDTKKLKQIENTICKYDLVEPQYGKILSSKSLENFVAKVVMNGDKNILSDDTKEYYLKIGKEYEDWLKTLKQKTRGPKLVSEKELNRLSNDPNKIVGNNKEMTNNNENDLSKN